MPHGVKKYYVDVRNGLQVFARAVVEVRKERTTVDVQCVDSDLAELAAYDLLLLAAENISPFPKEKAWIEHRCQEHSRIDPEAYLKARKRNEVGPTVDGEQIPF